MKKEITDTIREDLDRLVPFSIGNLTIRQVIEVLKNQNNHNTYWLTPRNIDNGIIPKTS